MTTFGADIQARLSELRINGGNEAETRFKIIDDVLLNFLGWSKEEITVEQRITEDGSDEFIDYFIVTAQTSLLIEAKKCTVDFSSMPKRRRSQLRGSWLKGDLKRAILQARDYGRKKGVGFCAVTNGDAWIIFPVNRRDLISFEDSFAEVFWDARTALIDDAADFSALLSRNSVIDGSLEQQLLGGDSNQLDVRRLNQIYDHSFSRVARQSLFTYIEDELTTAFSEELPLDNPDLLEKAYVETPERVRFDDRIKMAVSRREQVLQSRPLRPLGKGEFKRVSEKIALSRLSRRPTALLTLGLVGAGKTTFLNYIEKVSEREFFKDNGASTKAYWLYVDFKNYSKSMSPREHLIGKLFDRIRADAVLRDYDTTLKHAYAEDIEAITSGPLARLAKDGIARDREISALLMSDYRAKDPYVVKILRWLASKKTCFIVVDNVDQQEEPEIQSSIFLDALALARDCGLSMVLAMRDATYVANRSSAVFDAFDFDAIYIDPPDIRSVMSKRFVVASQLLKSKKFEFETEGAKVQVTDSSKIVNLLTESVLGTDVGHLIEVCATNDVRLALRMVRQFLQYGYSTSLKAFRLYQETGSYRFPPHEALRAIMLGNQTVYREEFSPIMNPFDARTGRSQSQFLRIMVAHALVSAASTRAFQGLEANEIIQAMEKLGFSQRVTTKVIRDLMLGRLCFTRSHSDFNPESILIPSRLCGYVVRELTGKLVFVETVLFDTFIFDDVCWNAVRSGMKSVYSERRPAQRLRLRKQISEAFFLWAEKECQKIVDLASARNLGPFWTINPLTAVRSSFMSDLERAERSAILNYGDDSTMPIGPLFSH